MTALELFRLRQNEELQRDLRELLDEFALALGATLNLSAGLEIFCLGAKRLFGADRTSVLDPRSPGPPAGAQGVVGPGTA